VIEYTPDTHEDADGHPHERCQCSASHAWTWWEPDPARRHHLHVEARWFRPPVNPCSRCKPAHERREATEATRRRQGLAGVPPRLRGYRLDNVRVQGTDEDPGIFAADVLGQRDVIGVTLANWRTFQAVRGWKPTAGGLYLEGHVGTGKSLLAAALVTRLLVVEEAQRIEYDDAEIANIHGWDNVEAVRRAKRDFYFRQTPPRQPLLITETELMRRVHLSWSGDKDPLKRVSDADVLVLDDLGVEGTHERVASSIERLICYRYDHKRPTFLTSNVPWEEIVDGKAPRYGARVASRMHQMITEVHVLGGLDWRNPPAPVLTDADERSSSGPRKRRNGSEGSGQGQAKQTPMWGREDRNG